MNYLAHAFLSPNDAFILTGNLVTDMVKGALRKELDVRFRNGILLHQHIDEYTDAHPLIIEMRSLIRKEGGKYTPVLVDLYMDLLLTTHWNKFTDIEIGSFKKLVYKNIELASPYLPDLVSKKIMNMANHDWLSVYSSAKGLHEVISRMQHRTSKPSLFYQSTENIYSNIDVMTPLFEVFFHEMINEMNRFSSQLYQ